MECPELRNLQVLQLPDGKPSQAAILELEQMLKQARGSEAVVALQTLLATQGNEPPTARVMRFLEAGMDADPVVFGSLMAQLYPFAARVRDHSTCDAVELWMSSTRSRELASALRSLADGVRPALARRLVSWAVWVGQE